MTLDLLGIGMVPSVLEPTPPFVDTVLAGSPADAAGVRADDLILEVDGVMIRSCSQLVERLSTAEQDLPLRWTLLRGRDLVHVTLQVPLSERVAP
jgi:serine protease Do